MDGCWPAAATTRRCGCGTWGSRRRGTGNRGYFTFVDSRRRGGRLSPAAGAGQGLGGLVDGGQAGSDVAGDADPNTGYKVLVDGQEMVIGGTSAGAPLMAGLLALINKQNGKPAGFIHPQLYANPGLCRDIDIGDNKTTSKNTGYSAGPGWDACTGFGVLSKLQMVAEEVV